MCLILDTNMYNIFLDSGNTDMKPVRDWVNRQNGKIAYSSVGSMKDELEKYRKMRDRFEQYRRAGKLKTFSPEDVEQEKTGLPELRSNDPYILALAQVSGVRLLVSADQKLHTDFKQIVEGKVYQTKKHTHLLKKDLCP